MSWRPWQNWEEEIILRHVGQISDLHKKLPHRTPQAIKGRRQLLGMSTRNAGTPWMASDIRVLRRVYYEGGIAAAVDAFPDRTKDTLKCTAKHHRMRARKRSKFGDSWPGCPPLVEDIRSELARRRMSLSEIARKSRTRIQVLCRGYVEKFGICHEPIAEITDQLGGELYVEWED